MIQQIETVAVYVKDQQKSKHFWTEKVGFVVHRDEPMGPEGNWLEVGPENAATRLVLYPQSMMPNWENLKPSIVFSCHDIHAFYEEMKGKGVKFLDEPKKMAWGTFVQFEDLDGNRFILKG
ncbi:VOC family protein [Salinithrix halophila]|uniref:VOC family protein n=1 Tax=Salinithrix halophila TaxID=1485204 RepID=A0ABV8JB53_9BACL